jgi:prophage regulatory protein
MQTFFQYNDLKERGIPYSEEHLRRLAKAGQFPKPVKLSDAGVNARKAWVAAEIFEWEQSKIDERDTGAPE